MCQVKTRVFASPGLRAAKGRARSPLLCSPISPGLEGLGCLQVGSGWDRPLGGRCWAHPYPRTAGGPAVRHQAQLGAGCAPALQGPACFEVSHVNVAWAAWPYTEVGLYPGGAIGQAVWSRPPCSTRVLCFLGPGEFISGGRREESRRGKLRACATGVGAAVTH